MENVMENGIPVTLDWESADRVVVLVLKDTYKTLLTEEFNIKNELSLGRTGDAVKQDAKDNKKQLKSVRRTLKYFMTRDEYKTFMKEICNGSE